MIRELMVNGAKNIPANYAAKVDMVTGMGVQVDHKAGQVKFPDAASRWLPMSLSRRASMQARLILMTMIRWQPRLRQVCW